MKKRHTDLSQSICPSCQRKIAFHKPGENCPFCFTVKLKPNPNYESHKCDVCAGR
jgi:hypothetical protein